MRDPFTYAIAFYNDYLIIMVKKEGKYVILLIKPMKNNIYIRKVHNWAFDEFKALAIVNKQNIVTHIATDAKTGVQQATILDEFLKNVLGKRKVEKLKPDDMLRYWTVKEAMPLTPQYKLDKPVRGIRYCNSEEELDIEKIVVKSWFKQYNLTHEHVFWNAGEYPRIYSSSIKLDFHKALFELEKTGELYKSDEDEENESDYKPIGTSRQSKLI